jgi:hypothetical protein
MSNIHVALLIISIPVLILRIIKGMEIIKLGSIGYKEVISQILISFCLSLAFYSFTIFYQNLKYSMEKDSESLLLLIGKLFFSNLAFIFIEELFFREILLRNKLFEDKNKIIIFNALIFSLSHFSRGIEIMTLTFFTGTCCAIFYIRNGFVSAFMFHFFSNLFGYFFVILISYN